MVTPIVTQVDPSTSQSIASPGSRTPLSALSSASPSRRSSFRQSLPNQAQNKNVNWLNSPGSWVIIVAMIILGWAFLSLFLPLGLAWTYLHLIHGVISYILLHWTKGSPVEMDQGKYDSLTFWEQLDDGVQYTSNRKFFTAIPIVTFILATNGSDFRKQPLGLNLIVLLVLLVAKLPSMHKIRIFGINKY